MAARVRKRARRPAPRNQSPTSPLDQSFYPEALLRTERQAVAWRRATTSGTATQDQDSSAGRWPTDEGNETIGLSLSGGGIRSATFSLGVLQALAETQTADGRSLLERIDFLSTVSGGGYIGSFLGRLFTRSKGDLKEAIKHCAPKDEVPDGPHGNLVSEVLKRTASEPVWWLRENARYLAPNGAGDYLVGAAFFLRSWLGVQFVLAVFASAVALGVVLLRFAVPFLFEWVLAQFDIGPAGMWSALEHVSLVPSSQPQDQTLLVSPLLGVPLTLSLAALVLNCGWFWLRAWGKVSARDTIRRRHWTVQFGSLMALVGVIGITGLIDSIGQTAYLRIVVQDDWRAMGVFVSSMIAVIAWIVSKTDKIASLAGVESKGKFAALLPWVARLAAVIVFLVYASMCGFAAHTVANWRPECKECSATGAQSAAMCGGDRPAATSKTVPKLEFVYNASAVPCLTTDKKADNASGQPAHLVGVVAVPIGHNVILRLAVGLAVILLPLSLFLGRWFPFLNLSTMAPLYGARLARAYLGASNAQRWTASGNPVTEPVAGDDCSTGEYRPELNGGPIHIVNVTFNETVSEKSNIESNDRKGLPLAVSPFGVSVGVSHHAAIVGRDTFGPAAAHAASTEAQDGPATVPLSTVEPGFDGRDAQGHTVLPDGKFRIFQMLPPRTSIPVEALQLSTWIAISGAAFSTGLGSRTNWAYSFLAGMFNVRMGYWWNSGVNPGDRNRETITPPDFFSYLAGEFARAFPVQSSLLDELLARFHGPARRYWYLSDGGHFDNTGCYELIRRRVPIIICCDDGADPDYEFEDISNLVRLARTDFGAEFAFLAPEALAEMEGLSKGAAEQLGAIVGKLDDLRAREGDSTMSIPVSKAHAAVAVVNYAGSDERSIVLFLKPSVTGDEKQDILNYREAHGTFPHETTADQFFDEAQWESYRRLGLHVGREVFGKTVGPAKRKFSALDLVMKALHAKGNKWESLLGRG